MVVMMMRGVCDHAAVRGGVVMMFVWESGGEGWGRDGVCVGEEAGGVGYREVGGSACGFILGLHRPTEVLAGHGMFRPQRWACVPVIAMTYMGRGYDRRGRSLGESVSDLDGSKATGPVSL